MTEGIHRRQFTGGLATAGAVLAAKSLRAAPGANERIRLGVIGVGSRGSQFIDAFKPHADAG